MLLGLTSCSKKNISKVQTIDSQFVMPELKSTVNILFKIDKEAINDTFNLIVDKYLDTNMEMEASGFEVKLKKQRNAELEFLGRQVLTTLPIHFELSRSGFLQNVSGSGELEINFITSIDIDSSWRLVTKTELANHVWTEKPNINLAGLKINVTSLADIAIEKSKPSLEKQIDLSVAEQVQFKEQLLEITKYVEKPILLDTVLNSWLHIVPENIYLSNIENQSQFSIGNMTVHGTTKFTSKEPDEVIPGLALPQFRWEDKLDDTSHINMVLDISYDQINTYLKENFHGQTFESDGRKITVKDLYMKREGEKLVVYSDVKGSLNGQLKVSGIPVFDNEKQLFYTDDIDIEIKTKNIFKKAGAWLFKGKIKNKLQDMMTYSISESIEEYQALVDRQVAKYSRQNEIEMKADIRQVKVNTFALDNDRIHAFITLNLYLETTVYNLSVLNNPTYFNLKN